MSEAGKNIMLGTAGHVDHGKTALVKLLTGCDTDRLAVEKQRGLTIELGFAPCAMRDERIVGIVDVPGHVDFIRNMVAGAQGVDVVIFVVAADDGVMPQTREHLDILTLMGVRRGLVALTKIDLVDAELRELVVEDVRELLAGTFLASAPICPISNITGEGFDGFFTAMNQEVDACEPRRTDGLFRLWVERQFSVAGFGTVVSGIPSSGSIRLGDRLRLLPDGLTGRVRHMEVYGRESEVGRAGECVALNVADVDSDLIARGKVLCEGDALQAVTMAEAELTLLPGAASPLKDYAEVHLHVGTGECMANVAMLATKHLTPGEHTPVQLRLKEPLGVAPGERFVIRGSMAGLAGGRMTTIGGGRILGVSNTRLRRNRPWTLEALKARLEAIDRPKQWCVAILKEARTALSAAELAARAALRAESVAGLLGELQAEGVALAGGGRFVHTDTVDGLARRIVEVLTEFHAANPLRMGMDRSDLATGCDADRAVFDLALARLTESREVASEGAVVVLAGRGAQLTDEDRTLYEHLEATLRAQRLEPLLPAELASAEGRPEEKVREMLRLLVDQALAVELSPKVVMHAEAVEAAKAVVIDLFRKASGFTTVEFRDALGVSRKFAVPLLDYFDTVRLTVRSGSRRTPGVEARRALES